MNELEIGVSSLLAEGFALGFNAERYWYMSVYTWQIQLIDNIMSRSNCPMFWGCLMVFKGVYLIKISQVVVRTSPLAALQSEAFLDRTSSAWKAFLVVWI